MVFWSLFVSDQGRKTVTPPFHIITATLTINPSAVFEKWVDQAPMLLTGTAVRSSNPIYAIVSTVYKRAWSIIETHLGDLTNTLYTEATPITDTTTFSLEVTDANSDVATDTKTITAVYPYFRGVVTGGSKPTKNQALIDSWNKVVADSDGPISVNFNSWATDRLWFAIPAAMTSKTKWFVDVLNHGAIWGASNLFDTESVVSIDSPDAYRSWVNYKIYVSNRQSGQLLAMLLQN